MRTIVLFIFLILALTGCSKQVITEKAPLEQVKHELDKLAPVDLKVDISHLASWEKAVLGKLILTAQVIDELFLLQVYPENPKIRTALQKSTSPDAPEYLKMFNIMFGPWNRLEENKPFINTMEKPDGAGFYPIDMSKQEFLDHMEQHPEEQDALESTFTVIRRKSGRLQAIPYHKAYAVQVKKISTLLNEAADLCEEQTLKIYLQNEAKAFMSDDYFEADMSWMDLNGNLEIVIAPYEVYEDNMFNYKAAYEAFICIVDHEESDKLARVSGYLDYLEKSLPIPDKYKNFNRGSSSPIKVVQELYTAGDTKAGIQTTAFNLPNDERVREAKGSKKVMLKNVARAKFDKCWIPIVNTILDEKPLAKVSFDSYFNHVLMHEMSHGLGPGIINLDGKETSVQKELKELYSTIEECKADVLGIYTMKQLMKKGEFKDISEYTMYASYLGGMFRSIRFGIDEAHGGGVAIQFNYLMEKGAFKRTKEGKLTLNRRKVMPALTDLARMLLTIEAEGDYNAAKALIDKYRQMTPVMQEMIENLQHVPVDIKPNYPTAESLLAS